RALDLGEELRELLLPERLGEPLERAHGAEDGLARVAAAGDPERDGLRDVAPPDAHDPRRDDAARAHGRDAPALGTRRPRLGERGRLPRLALELEEDEVVLLGGVDGARLPAALDVPLAPLAEEARLRHGIPGRDARREHAAVEDDDERAGRLGG